MTSGYKKPDHWAIGAALLAVGAAVFGRVAAAAGAPGFIVFIHFPLVLMAAVTTSHPANRYSKRTMQAIVLFTAWVAFSSLANGTSPLRALLSWIVWIEPLIVLYVVASVTSSEQRNGWLRATWIALIGVVAAQFVMMTLQLPLRSLGPDEMQGTFVGSGTGAHTAPAVLLLGIFMLIGRMIDYADTRVRFVAGVLVTYGFALSVLGAARAVSAVGVAAAALGIAAMSWRSRQGQKTVRAVLTLLVVLAGLVVGATEIASSADAPILRRGLDAKVEGTLYLARAINNDAASIVVGLGPANTLSRVALETPDARLNSSSAIAALDLETAPITRAITQMQAVAGIGGSSLFSPWTSLVGLWGDIGVVGLVLYVGMWMPTLALVWDRSVPTTQGVRFVLLATLLLAFGLGAYQIFLEDPGFTLPAAALLGATAGTTMRRESGKGLLASTVSHVSAFSERSPPQSHDAS